MNDKKLFLLNDFINNPPQEFALLGLPSGEIHIFIGPFEAYAEASCNKNQLYFNDFLLTNSKPFLSCSSTFSIENALCKDVVNNINFVPPKIIWSDAVQSQFLESFAFFREHLKNKTLSKAVPISFSLGKLSSPRLQQNEISYLIRKLVSGQPGLYSYALKINGTTIVGASPEILFALDNNNLSIESEAVAGSIIATHAPLSEITGKLREEHDLVVDDLVIQLEKFARVEKGEISLKSLSGLSHLRTPLKANLFDKVQISTLIAALHPSGALGILPRAGLEDPLLLALDPSRLRQCFGAPFGAILEDGKAIMLVAIRNLIFNEDKVLLGAGAGITAQSDANSELQEILAKQHSVKSFFGL